MTPGAVGHHARPATAWAWVGIVLSVAFNVLFAWVVVDLVSRPDVPLQPPPTCEKPK